MAGRGCIMVGQPNPHQAGRPARTCKVVSAGGDDSTALPLWVCSEIGFGRFPMVGI